MNKDVLIDFVLLNYIRKTARCYSSGALRFFCTLNRFLATVCIIFLHPFAQCSGGGSTILQQKKKPSTFICPNERATCQSTVHCHCRGSINSTRSFGDASEMSSAISPPDDDVAHHLWTTAAAAAAAIAACGTSRHHLWVLSKRWEPGARVCCCLCAGGVI